MGVKGSLTNKLLTVIMRLVIRFSRFRGFYLVFGACLLAFGLDRTTKLSVYLILEELLFEAVDKIGSLADEYH